MSVQQIGKLEYLKRFMDNPEPQTTKGKKKKKAQKLTVKLIDEEDFLQKNKKSDDEDDILDEENVPVFVDNGETSKLTANQKILALSNLQTEDKTRKSKKSSSSSRSSSATSNSSSSGDSDNDSGKKKGKKSKKGSKKAKKNSRKRRHDSDSEPDDEIMKIEKEAQHVKKFKSQMNKALGMEGSDNDDDQQPTTTVHRDEFGRKIDIDKIIKDKLSQKEQKEELKRKNQERIDEWGKGMKQQEKKTQQKQDEINASKETYNGDYTISKQAEVELMKQERFNDPMRLLIQKEDQKIASAQTNLQNKQICRLKCRFPGVTNRFDIPPGHMWDGVDRGNGAEKKYFNMINQKKDRANKAHEMATLDL